MTTETKYKRVCDGIKTSDRALAIAVLQAVQAVAQERGVRVEARRSKVDGYRVICRLPTWDGAPIECGSVDETMGRMIHAAAAALVAA